MGRAKRSTADERPDVGARVGEESDAAVEPDAANAPQALAPAGAGPTAGTGHHSPQGHERMSPTAATSSTTEVITMAPITTPPLQRVRGRGRRRYGYRLCDGPRPRSTDPAGSLCRESAGRRRAGVPCSTAIPAVRVCHWVRSERTPWRVPGPRSDGDGSGRPRRSP